MWCESWEMWHEVESILDSIRFSLILCTFIMLSCCLKRGHGSMCRGLAESVYLPLDEELSGPATRARALSHDGCHHVVP